jgi:hypothetical protein
MNFFIKGVTYREGGTSIQARPLGGVGSDHQEATDRSLPTPLKRTTSLGFAKKMFLPRRAGLTLWHVTRHGGNFCKM